MERNRMYEEFAHLWPHISDPSEYADEARYWRKDRGFANQGVAVLPG